MSSRRAGDRPPRKIRRGLALQLPDWDLNWDDVHAIKQRAKFVPMAQAIGEWMLRHADLVRGAWLSNSSLLIGQKWNELFGARHKNPYKELVKRKGSRGR